MKLPKETGGHSVHVLTYHIVWCVKYRRSVLTHEIGDRIKAILQELAEKQDCTLLAVETDVDHVHMLVRLKPTHQISKLVNSFKGVTARRIFQEFPSLKKRLWGGHLWSPSYYVTTTGGAPIEAIKKYVESQREK